MDRKIINTYDQMKAYGGDRVALTYQPAGDGRVIRLPGWHVIRLIDGQSVVTDPEAAWYDNGKKFFMVKIGKHHEQKMTAFEAASDWANVMYGPRKFVRNRMRDYVEEAVNKAFPIQRD